MKKINKTKYVILGMLSAQEMCGYDISKAIQNSIANFWSESNGQLYPTLSKLVREDLILCVSENATNSTSKTPKIYRITKKGLHELKKWLESSIEGVPTFRNELLLKLFFGNQISKKACLQHIVQRKQWATEQYQKYEAKIKNLKISNKNNPSLPYWLLTLEYGLNARKAEINWCIKSIELLEQAN